MNNKYIRWMSDFDDSDEGYTLRMEKFDNLDDAGDGHAGLTRCIHNVILARSRNFVLEGCNVSGDALTAGYVFVNGNVYNISRVDDMSTLIGNNKVLCVDSSGNLVSKDVTADFDDCCPLVLRKSSYYYEVGNRYDTSNSTRYVSFQEIKLVNGKIAFLHSDGMGYNSITLNPVSDGGKACGEIVLRSDDDIITITSRSNTPKITLDRAGKSKSLYNIGTQLVADVGASDGDAFYIKGDANHSVEICPKDSSNAKTSIVLNHDAKQMSLYNWYGTKLVADVGTTGGNAFYIQGDVGNRVEIYPKDFSGNTSIVLRNDATYATSIYNSGNSKLAIDISSTSDEILEIVGSLYSGNPNNIVFDMPGFSVYPTRANKWSMGTESNYWLNGRFAHVIGSWIEGTHSNNTRLVIESYDRDTYEPAIDIHFDTAEIKFVPPGDESGNGWELGTSDYKLRYVRAITLSGNQGYVAHVDANSNEAIVNRDYLGNYLSSNHYEGKKWPSTVREYINHQLSESTWGGLAYFSTSWLENIGTKYYRKVVLVALAGSSHGGTCRIAVPPYHGSGKQATITMKTVDGAKSIGPGSYVKVYSGGNLKGSDTATTNTKLLEVSINANPNDTLDIKVYLNQVAGTPFYGTTYITWTRY